MDEDLDRMLVSVRADTGAFARDVAAMKAELEGTLAGAAERAGMRMETALVRAARTGKLGFDDLKRVALGVLEDIAAAAIRGGIGALGGKGGGDLGSLLGSLLGSVLGLPGRATDGPVSPGRAYLVGERGPEVFVPTASGRVETMSSSGGREVRLTVNINAPVGGEARALDQSARQVARAARAALMRVE